MNQNHGIAQTLCRTHLHSPIASALTIADHKGVACKYPYIPPGTRLILASKMSATPPSLRNPYLQLFLPSQSTLFRVHDITFERYCIHK